MSSSKRIALIVFVVAAAVVAFVALKPDDRESGGKAPRSANRGAVGDKGSPAAKPAPPRPAVTTIHVQGGKPAGGLAKIKVKKDEPVRLAVTSMDRKGGAVAVHVHGYNLVKKLRPGGVARFDFPAKIEGVFEVEFHAQPPQKLAEIEVRP